MSSKPLSQEDWAEQFHDRLHYDYDDAAHEWHKTFADFEDAAYKEYLKAMQEQRDEARIDNYITDLI